MTKPKLSLPIKESGQLIIFERRHWIWLFNFFILLALGTIIPLVIGLILVSIFPGATVELVKDILVILLTFYYLLLAYYGLGEWVKYYYEVLICTDKNLIKVGQKGLTNRQINEIPLEEIASISAKINGFLASFFLYGDITIETVGLSKEVYNFRMISDPIKVANVILSSHNEIVTKEKKGQSLEAPEQSLRSSKIVTELLAHQVESGPITKELVKVEQEGKAASEGGTPSEQTEVIRSTTTQGIKGSQPSATTSQKKGRSVMEIIQEETIFPPPKPPTQPTSQTSSQNQPRDTGRSIPQIFFDSIFGTNKPKKK